MVAAATTRPAAGSRLVVVAGNPNAGKTTLFNQLTGGSAHVANYPGVTVEHHEGDLALPRAGRVHMIDVPGAYSLSARSPEEQLAINVIAGLPPHEHPPDLVVLVVDATQLARNLYFTLQVLELGVPAVVALNMTDMLAGNGLTVDHEALARELGVPVVPIAARSGLGIEEVRRAMDDVLSATGARARRGWSPVGGTALAADVEAVAAALPAAWAEPNSDRARALASWALLSTDSDSELVGVPASLAAVVARRRELAAADGREIDSEIIGGRYRWIDERSARFLRESSARQTTVTDRVDRILLHPLVGFGLFLVIMTVVFQSLFSWSDPVISWIEGGFGALSDLVRASLPAGFFTDFLTEGLLAGAGSVIVFLPQILLLFLFIGLLEDTGYMARVAFLMDRIMKAIGLHGRAFVPMMSAYACAIPAIMATRTMERRRDRYLTMMVIPLMTCSARLPVYGLLIAAMVPAGAAASASWIAGRFTQGLLMAGMYLFSTAVALICAAVLGRTLFKGRRVPLLMEMPPYRLPHWPSVLRLMVERSFSFLKNAGTVILACVIGMWLLLSFPRPAAVAEEIDRLRSEIKAAQADEAGNATRLARVHELEARRLRDSYGGRLGRAIEPAIEPLGFDWKIGVGIIGAFAAREVFVGTMGVVEGIGSEAEESTALRDRLQGERWPDGRRVFTPLTCFTLMIFFALACQCMSTLAVVRRETRTWRWPVFLFVYMTALAWIVSFVVYQTGRLLGYA